MRIAVIGTGYVGLPTGAALAEKGNEVICVDRDPAVLETLRRGEVHFFEPGLAQIVQRTVGLGNLSFTDNLREAVARSDVSFIAVGTPSREDGSFDLRYFFDAARDIGDAIKDSEGFKIIVGKSTVPQRTWEEVTRIVRDKVNNGGVDWAYVSNPETLAEGTAVRDVSRPDRIIVGTDSDRAFEIMRTLYYPFVRDKGPDAIIRMSPASAELTKLGANTVLASRIAVIDEIARIADVTPGADMEEIRRGICSDARIGIRFSYPGPGYGGSCFPKDIQGLVERARENGYDPLLLSRIHPSNEGHKSYMGDRIMTLLRGPGQKRIGVWGVTFKPGTDDMRDAASLPILTRFINKGAAVSVYDPKDVKAREIFGSKVNFVSEQYAAAKDADALVLLTEWDQFDSPDFARLGETMRGRTVFDLRNRWQPRIANEAGFNYYGVGRNHPLAV